MLRFCSNINLVNVNNKFYTKLNQNCVNID